MRAALAAGLVLVGVLAGGSAAGRLKGRRETLYLLCSDMRRLADMLELCPLPMNRMIARLPENALSGFWKLLGDMLGEREPLGDIWRAAVRKSACGGALAPLGTQELAAAMAFGDALALSDTPAQLSAMKLLIRETEASVAALDGEIAKKGRLYPSLGLLFGLAAALMAL